jgi:hypothetical protein
MNIVFQIISAEVNTHNPMVERRIIGSILK